jgi:hypothetical protein
VHAGDDVLAVDLDHRTLGCAERDVQDGTVLGDVDLLASEHGIDAIAQTGALGQRDEQPERLGGDAVLRIVEVHAVELDGHVLAALRVVGEQVTEVDVAQLREVSVERAPLRRLGDRRHAANPNEHLGVDPHMCMPTLRCSGVRGRRARGVATTPR